jgi:peptidoglycan/xylan/chitin deacetylase (PgdA/CDA1 family)
MYHRVLPHEHPDRVHEEPGMYVSPQTFELHLQLLRRQFTLVHLDEWLSDAGAGRPLPRAACAVTFDDGWRDNFDHAFPLLRKHGVPATIFLVADLIGTRYSFWPNRLSRLLRSAHAPQVLQSLPEQLRAAAGEPAFAGRDMTQLSDSLIAHSKTLFTDAQMNSLLDSIEPAHGGSDPEGRDLASWDEIRAMGVGDLVRFGSHTRRHTRLRTDLDARQLEDEIVSSQRVLADQLGTAPRTFCYPNGDHCPAAVAMVRDNYLGAVTTRHGWNSPRSDRWLLQRVGVHDDVSKTQTQFLARLAGVG